MIIDLLLSDVASPFMDGLEKDLTAAAEIPESLLDDLLVNDVVQESIIEWKQQLKNVNSLSKKVENSWFRAFRRGLTQQVENKIKIEGLANQTLTIVSNCYHRYMRNIFKNLKVAKSENFIENLNIKKRKKSHGASALPPPAESDEPEERRSSMAKVPDWLQGVRERNTMKPTQVQAISEEIKGATRQTVSGNER